MKLTKTHTSIAILSFYCFFLILFRIKITNSFFYGFLIWNLFLAYIPFGISTILKEKTTLQNSKFKFWILFTTWLLFLPNAPYIITDFVHLQQGKAMPYWYDLLVISTFALNGMLLFFISINDMHKIIQQKFSKTKAWFSTTMIFFLCGFGIYLGRFLRWNSWDIIHKPQLLIKDIIMPIINPTQHPKTWGVTLGFGLLFTISFFIFKTLHNNSKINNDI